jgi:multimeric flavodoxin WrbA
MNVIGISTSMRKRGSNSEWMIRKVLSAAKEAGARTELILLKEHRINPCRGCDYCWNSGRGCKVKDDMQKMYRKLLSADAIVFGSPNYFQNVTAVAKAFIDRTNALVIHHGVRGNKETIWRLSKKRAVGVCCGGQDMDDIAFCERAIRSFFSIHRMNIIAMVKARADKPSELENRESKEATEKELSAAGRKLVRGR